MTSSDLKRTSKESDIKKKLNGGDANNDNSTQGRGLFEQALSSQQMVEFREIIEKKLKFKTK